MDTTFPQKMNLARADLMREIEQTESRMKEIKRIVERSKYQHDELYVNDRKTEIDEEPVSINIEKKNEEIILQEQI